jgi:DUF1009 family protein
MHENRITALVVEAGKAIMLDPQGILEAAHRLDIAIIAAEDVSQLERW